MKRYGFVGIIIRNREASAARIQEILSRHAAVVRGRLGRLPGVVVKSALEPMGEEQR